MMIRRSPVRLLLRRQRRRRRGADRRLVRRRLVVRGRRPGAGGAGRWLHAGAALAGCLQGNQRFRGAAARRWRAAGEDFPAL